MGSRSETRTAAMLVVALGSITVACGDSAGAGMQQGTAPPILQPMPPGQIAPTPTTTPGAPGTNVNPPAMMPGQTTPPPAATAGTSAPAPSEGMQTPTTLDPCKDFVVSRTKPCHNDPNPCGIDSGFPGDEYCLVPPAEGEGVQAHFGPRDYKNAAEVAGYVLDPDEEFNDYGVAPVPGTEERFYNRVVYSMRPGSHHLINSLVDGQPTPGFQPAGAGCPGTRIGTLGGTQNLIYDSRPNGIVPPENEGLAYTLPGNSNICFNFHRYNTTDAQQLSEIWVNFYFVDEAEVTQRASWGVIIGGLGLLIPPGDEQELTYSYTFPSAEPDARIIQLFGHRHAATYRFAAWLNDDLIYDSWDWYESITFNYDSLTTNPPIDPTKMLDGGHSGILPVKSGDVIKYTCFIRNETMNTLRFANELYTGEMCNLFGQSVGARFFGTFF